MQRLSSLFVVVTLLLGVHLAGCGARTGYEGGGDERDGGVDAPADVFMDTPIDTTPPPPVPLEVACSASEMIRPGGSANFSVEVVDEDGVGPFVYRWTSDGVTFSDPSAQATSASSGEEGIHPLVAEVVESSTGRVGECSTNLAVVNGPPLVACMDTVGPVGEVFEVVGEAFDDEGIVSQRWEVLDMGLTLQSDNGGGVAEVIGFEAATYRMQFTAQDTDGATVSCIARVRLTEPPQLECPTEPVGVPTRQPTTLTVPVSDDGEVVRHDWDVLDPEDGYRLRPNENRARFTAERQGPYTVRYVATDDDGLSSTCEFVVIGLPTPPELTCPGEVVTSPLTPTELTVSAVDDGDSLTYSWSLGARPEGSDAQAPGGNGPTTTFTPDLAGEYEVQVGVRDEDGMTDSCVIRVLAVSSQGLRMELSWDTDNTDMDSHLLRPGAAAYNNEDDCYYGNCTNGLEWGDPGPDDNPRLDIDDTDGFGPENINIDEPYSGRYRVAIDAYRGNATRIVVRLFCGGSDTEPVEVFTGRLRDGQLWEVADVIIDGPSCSIEAIDSVTDGFPNP